MKNLAGNPRVGVERKRNRIANGELTPPPDDSLACGLLAAESDMEVAGECEDGEQALAAVRSLSIDILFLDVRMPRKDGFQVLESLAAGHLPLVVFVTAHQEFAVRAFEFNSIDYLLKPFDRARFQRTLTRVRERLATRQPLEDNAFVREILRYLRAGAGSGLRIPVKQGRKVLFIRQETIDWIEAADNYLILHCGKQDTSSARP